MKIAFRTCFFVNFACVLSLSNVVHAVVIDDFGDGAITVERDGFSEVSMDQVGLNPANVLGGRRSLTVGTFGSATQTATVDTSQGQLRLQTSDTFGYFEICYGGDTNPLNVNLLAAGANAFEIDVLDVSPDLFRGIYDIRVESCVYVNDRDVRSTAVQHQCSGENTLAFCGFFGAGRFHRRSENNN